LAGGRDTHVAAIALCRRFHGRVLWRYGDAIVIEVGGAVDLPSQLERLLPLGHITHRSWIGATEGANPPRQRRSPPARANGTHHP
jgi:hypothetical protein